MVALRNCNIKLAQQIKFLDREGLYDVISNG